MSKHLLLLLSFHSSFSSFSSSLHFICLLSCYFLSQFFFMNYLTLIPFNITSALHICFLILLLLPHIGIPYIRTYSPSDLLHRFQTKKLFNDVIFSISPIFNLFYLCSASIAFFSHLPSLSKIITSLQSDFHFYNFLCLPFTRSSCFISLFSLLLSLFPPCDLSG